MIRSIMTVILLSLSLSYSKAQGTVGIKTNLLYGGVTLTPNLGVEIGLGSKNTLGISAGYNPWNVRGNDTGNRKLAHFIIQPEFRHFLCKRFNRHFFGAHALYSQYNISEHKLPMLFGKDSKKYRFQGDAYGTGVSYGYQLMISNYWNLEFEIGVGYARMHYSKYDCLKCGEKIESTHRNYWGPTKAGISLIYIIK